MFGRDLQGDLGDQYTRSRYYHLYLNGQYWGVFQTQERVEEDYAATYFGGEPEDYDIVKPGLNDGVPTEITEGNDIAWRQLFDFAQAMANNPDANANNYWTMQGLNPDGTRNPALPVLLDVDNLVDYMLIIFYTGGYDTGISRFLGDNQANNWYGIYNRVAADQGFQFFIHDNEHSLGAGDGGARHAEHRPHGPVQQRQSEQLRLIQSHVPAPGSAVPSRVPAADHRPRTQYFIGNGPMTPAANIARMQERKDQVDPPIIAEAARWGDSKIPEQFAAHDKTTWTAEINWLLNTYFPGRTSVVINQLRDDGLYVMPPVIARRRAAS